MTHPVRGSGAGERALRAMLREPEDLAYPLVTDLAMRPVTVDVIAPHSISTSQKVAAVIFVLFPALFLALGVGDDNFALIGIALFLFALVGLTFWIMRKRAGMQWQICWRDRSVDVVDRRWDRNALWSAPYSDFLGIAIRKGRIPRHGRGTHGSGRRLLVTELVHEDPDKTLILESNDPSPQVEERARANAGYLDVPFLNGSS